MAETVGATLPGPEDHGRDLVKAGDSIALNADLVIAVAGLCGKRGRAGCGRCLGTGLSKGNGSCVRLGALITAGASFSRYQE